MLDFSTPQGHESCVLEFRKKVLSCSRLHQKSHTDRVQRVVWETYENQSLCHFHELKYHCNFFRDHFYFGVNYIIIYLPAQGLKHGYDFQKKFCLVSMLMLIGHQCKKNLLCFAEESLQVCNNKRGNKLHIFFV